MSLHLQSTFAVVVLVLALALLVAAASVDAPLRSLLQGGHADRTRIIVDLLPVLLLGAGLAVAAALVAHRRKGDRPGAPRFRTTLMRLLPLAAAGTVVVCLLLIAHFDFGSPGDDRGTRILVHTEPRPLIVWSMSGWFEGLALASEGTDDPERQMEVGTVGGGRLSFLQLAAGLLAALLGGVILWYWRRRRLHGDRAEAEEEDAGDGQDTRERTREALAETIRAMLADPDPNTAIRGAYARLLQGLDERGRGRLEHEGPTEHLQRVLTSLRVRPAPLRELIELFELARFSPHPLGRTHRDRALTALRAVAGDLETAPGGGP